MAKVRQFAAPKHAKSFATFVVEANDTAYKGYLIRINPITGQCWIEKDGFRISYAKDVADAKKTIDMLTEAVSPRQQLQALRAEVNRLREYSSQSDYITDIEERNGELSFDVRYLGDWEVPPDEEDDGDYDWKQPTAGTRKRLDALVKKYPGTKWFNQGEKCWLTFTIKGKLSEDAGTGAAANAAGTGNIAGLGVGPKGEPGVDLRKRKKDIEKQAKDAGLAEDFENPSNPKSIAKSLAQAAQADAKRKAERGAILDKKPDGTVIKVGRRTYTKTTIDGDVFWTWEKGGLTSSQLATEMGTRLVDEGVEPSDTFAGAPVFEVDMDRLMNVKGPKHPRHRYSRYVGTDDIGEGIRQHGRSTRGDIIIKDSATAVMTYLRRKHVKK